MIRRLALFIVAGALAGCTATAGEPPATAPADPHAALDAMDRRKPVPLLPMMALHQKENMRDHLEAVEGIVAGLATGDHAAVEKAARRIASSPHMTRMCNHMGMGAPGFTEMALAFHEKADAIVAAARRKDDRAVLGALRATLSACTGCHATFKQRVVGPEEWSRLTGGQAPPHP